MAPEILRQRNLSENYVVNNDFWGNVKNLIKKNDTYQEWVAHKCGVKPRTFQNWIYRNIPPNIFEGQKIAEALETTIEYLVTGNPPADMPEDIMAIVREAKKLNTEGKKAALGAIQGLQAHYPQEREEIPVYADTQPIALETKDREPPYPQSETGDTPAFENDVEYLDWEMVMIPYFGKTAAGIPLDIYAEPGAYMTFPRKALKGSPDEYFVLGVQGYSMSEADINEGDMVVIRHTEDPIDGKIMLIRHEGASTLKRLSHRDGKWYLCWDDNSGMEIQVDSSCLGLPKMRK
jgi:SOS-response transcriptional repressor LexA